MPLQEHWKISIIVPLEIGQEPSDNPIVEKLIRHLGRQADKGIGRTGNYSGVFAMQRGEGGYEPEEGSHPAQGEQGKKERGPCAILSTNAPKSVSLETVRAYCDEVAAMHPWEHPTIEVTTLLLWMPED